MDGPFYHAGELAVQAKAEVSEQSQHATALIHETMPSIAREFLKEQRMAIVSTLDSSGCVWASVLTGPRGFIQAVDSRTVRICATPVPGDALIERLSHTPKIGVFVIELSTRRRMKVKGQLELAEDGAWVIHVERVYSQCRKYIQIRKLIEESPQPVDDGEIIRTESLTDGQQVRIAEADTFFVASFHPEIGTDASHRGGNPGFVEVVDKGTLVFPNYWGNTMFNTLGNITSNPHAGLLFIDFARGSTLQITGKAYVIWDKERVSKLPGANQAVEFHVSQVIETPHAIPLRWKFLAYSGANPVAPSAPQPASEMETVRVG